MHSLNSSLLNPIFYPLDPSFLSLHLNSSLQIYSEKIFQTSDKVYPASARKNRPCGTYAFNTRCKTGFLEYWFLILTSWENSKRSDSHQIVHYNLHVDCRKTFSAIPSFMVGKPSINCSYLEDKSYAFHSTK
jgi:hypothetical protein